VLAASAASAGEGKDSSTKSGGERGGGGASTTGGATEGAGVGGATETGAREIDRVTGERKPIKPYTWEAGLVWEAHTLLVQNDLMGAAQDKFFNYYYGFFKFDFLKYNRLELRYGLYQRFLADANESGVRSDDIVGSYTRYIPLPLDFRASVKASALIPTGYVSQLYSIITVPRITLGVDKYFGKYVTLTLRGFEEVYIEQYTSHGGLNSGNYGESPSPIDRVAAIFDSNVAMPFHPRLSAGLGLYTGYTWYYSANAITPPLPGYPQNQPGPVQNPIQQPVQQTYGGEIYVRYTLPSLAGFTTDFQVALAMGDPSLGYTSRLHDGVSHIYLGWYGAGRQASELYGALTVRY